MFTISLLTCVKHLVGILLTIQFYTHTHTKKIKNNTMGNVFSEHVVKIEAKASDI